MSADTIEQQARQFMDSEIPQIKQHGGSFEIREVDPTAGTATVAIGGACSGCGIAPMTMKAIKRQLPARVDGLDAVEVVRADGTSGAPSGRCKITALRATITCHKSPAERSSLGSDDSPANPGTGQTARCRPQRQPPGTRVSRPTRHAASG